MNERKIKILYLENDPNDEELVLRVIEKSGIACEMKRVEEEMSFRKGIREFRPDVIFADYMLPAYNAEKALELVTEEGIDIPVIVITGTVGEDIAVECLKKGASDYLLKGNLIRLPKALEAAVEKGKMIREKTRNRKKLIESEERFRRLFNEAPLGYQSLDETSKILFVNQTWLEMTGFTRDEILYKHFWEIVYPEDRDMFKDRFEEFKRTGEIKGNEVRLLKKDGNVIIVSIHGKVGYDEAGNFKQTHCMVRDITREKKTQREKEKYLHELEIFYESAKGREERILELKKEIVNLREKLGMDPDVG